MSLTSRYGSSVSRDYALLQGHPSSYQHFGALGARLAREEQTAEQDSNTSLSQDHDEDIGSTSRDGSSSVTPSADNADNLSNISIPNQLSVPSSPQFNRTAHATHLGPVSPLMHPRRTSVNAIPQVAGIPSEYLLGGPAIPPTISTSHREAAGNHFPHADESDLPTPGPASYGNGPILGMAQKRLSNSHETSSLLPQSTSSEETSISAYGATNQTNVNAPHRIHATNGTPGRPRRRSSISAASITSGGPGVSGWAAAQMMNEVPVPGVEQIDAIEHEPQDHIAWREARVITRYTIPIWLTHLLELSLSTISVITLGHLGTLELAAASLATMTANVSGFSVVSGFISALDTILPSAYTQQPKSVGLWTQRMAIVLAGIMPLIALVWINSERLLILMGQDPAVAKLASQYLVVLSLGLPGYACFETCRRYLQAQGLMHAPTIVLLFVSPLNAVINYLLVWGPDSVRIGFVGAPVASAISMWLMAILCFLQCVLAPRDAWDGFTTAAFKWAGIKPVLSLGVAGMLSLAAEWWAWEIVGLVTAALGTTALAAQSVLLVSSSVTYQLPFGASVATAVRVGNLLGANRAREAKISSNVALIISLVMGGINSGLYLIFRKQWGWMFSSDVEVVRLVDQILPLLAAFQVADGICGIAGGVLRGTGRQAQGAIINMTAYYFVGIPIGLILTFTKINLGLEGLWWGLTIALLYGSVGIYALIARTDWDWEVKKVQIRMTLDDPNAGVVVPDVAALAKGDPEAQPMLSNAATTSGRQNSLTGSVIAESEDEDDDETA